jgi:hypothetical protein
MDTDLEVEGETDHVLGDPPQVLGRLPEVSSLDGRGDEVDASHATGSGTGQHRVHPPWLLGAPDAVTELACPRRLDGRFALDASLSCVAIDTAGRGADVAARAEIAGFEGTVPTLAIIETLSLTMRAAP